MSQVPTKIVAVNDIQTRDGNKIFLDSVHLNQFLTVDELETLD